MNGVNLALIAYCHDLRLPEPAAQSTNAAAWRESVLHLRSCIEVRECLYDGYWRLDDPLPALAFFFDLALQGGRRAFTRPIFERRKPPFRRRRTA